MDADDLSRRPRRAPIGRAAAGRSRRVVRVVEVRFDIASAAAGSTRASRARRSSAPARPRRAARRRGRASSRRACACACRRTGAGPRGASRCGRSGWCVCVKRASVRSISARTSDSTARVHQPFDRAPGEPAAFAQDVQRDGDRDQRIEHEPAGEVHERRDRAPRRPRSRRRCRGAGRRPRARSTGARGRPPSCGGRAPVEQRARNRQGQAPAELARSVAARRSGALRPR